MPEYYGFIVFSPFKGENEHKYTVFFLFYKYKIEKK